MTIDHHHWSLPGGMTRHYSVVYARGQWVVLYNETRHADARSDEQAALDRCADLNNALAGGLQAPHLAGDVGRRSRSAVGRMGYSGNIRVTQRTARTVESQ